MERVRIVQLIEILRRVKPKEMIKLKFSTNFGVSVDTIEKVTLRLYFAPINEIQRILDELEDNQLMNLYLYMRFCDDLLHQIKIYKEKNKISTKILKPFF